MVALDLVAALPELFLACVGMALLMVGVFRRGDPTRLVLLLSVISVLVALAIVVLRPVHSGLAFGGLFITDDFADFMKILVLLGSALTMAMSLRYIEQERMARFEFPVLMLYATLGMLMMVSGERPDLALPGPRAAEPVALCDCRVPARQSAVPARPG